MVKAISLLSGGLDSILATKIIKEQGIKIYGLNFTSIFCTCTPKSFSCSAAKSSADKLKIELKVISKGKEYLKTVKNPKFGYGKNMNPCLDCRIYIFKKTKEYMKEKQADFIITGEVLGERPMSQRKKAMKLIEKESNLKGWIVRPLSAKLLRPSIPEEKGWVDRTKLMNISGRSRKPQINLANKFSIKDYPCPAGGCILTDPGFARRMKDLIKHNPNFDMRDAKFLKIGRHFRLSPNSKLIVGRNKQENDKLTHLFREKDIYIKPKKVKGPVGIITGNANGKNILKYFSILARYCDSKSYKKIVIAHTTHIGSDKIHKSIEIYPEVNEKISKQRI